MVTHFVCLTPGCLQDDKQTASHWVTAEFTEPITMLAWHSLYQEAGACHLGVRSSSV